MNSEMQSLVAAVSYLDTVDADSLPGMYRRRLEYARRGLARTVRVCTRLAEALRARQSQRESLRARLAEKLARLQARLESLGE